MHDTPATPNALSPEKLRLLHALAAKQGIPASRLPIVQVDRAAEGFPLSAAQRRMWLLHQLEDASRYNTSWVFSLSGALDVPALERALSAIVARHETLRTVFFTEEEQPQQRIVAPYAVPLPVTDLRGEDASAREPAMQAHVRRSMRAPLDLARGPLFRAELIRLEDDRHVLVATTHHIVSDGWSGGVFAEELHRFYDDFSAGRAPRRDALPIQYVDFACWQRALQNGPVGAKQASYWREQLRGLPRLPLTTDRPRRADLEPRGGTVQRAYGRARAASVATLAERGKASTFMVLLAAFGALLGRLTGTRDLPIGSPIANRNRRELEALIGFFVNTLVLRVDLDGDPSFTALVERVRQMTLDGYAHQEHPFDRLVDELEVVREPGVMPLFQVAFMVQNPPSQQADAGSLRMEPVMVDDETVRLDLEVQMWISEDGALESFWTFDRRLFDESTIARMAATFEILLDGMIAAPELPITRHELVAGEDRVRLLEGFNDTAEVAPFTSLPHAVARWAARAPARTAVVDDNGALTYGELDRQAERLARRLCGAGVTTDTVVAVALPRERALVVAILAIMRAGGAYLPIDPAYPATRLDFMLRDAGAAHLVTRGGVLPALEVVPRHVVDLDAVVGDQDDDAGVEGALPDALSPEQLAYVIYTSGSTGTPKGVLLGHRGLSNLAHAQRLLFGLTPEDRVLQFASPSFDASVWEIDMALTAGASLHLAAPAALQPGTPLEETLVARGITCATLPPTALRLLSPAALPALRTLVSAGEACDEALVDAWAPGRSFVNAYGPTEVTVCASAARCEAGAVPVIGTPLVGFRLYVLDRAGLPVPVGVPGELAVGGPALARGYQRRPGLTAERFVPSPFGGEPGARLYRTGDLVRWLADGSLDFLGRVDHQVKIRGFRIELGEIETTLAGHDAVRDVAVIVEGSDRHARLMACIASDRADDEALSETLRSWLAERLPAHLVPALWLVRDALPLTPAKKIDRHALAALDPARPGTGASAEAPRGVVEETIAEVWQALLGVDRVGRDDNFYALGGDSILLIQMLARLRRRGLEVRAEEAAAHQSVALLATVAREAVAIDADQGLIEGEVVPLPIQHWFLERGAVVRDHFNQATMLEVPADWQTDRLGRALARLEQHHDALRLRWRRAENGDDRLVHVAPWRATDAEALPPWLELHDLSSLDADARTEALESRASALQAGLDIAEGPIQRVALFRFPDGAPSRLLWVVHHLVVDGFSWPVLVEDLLTLMAADDPMGVALPAKTTAFASWSARLAAHASSATVWGERDFWLAGTDAVSLPEAGDDVESLASPAGRTVHVRFDTDFTKRVLRTALPGRGPATEAMLLTAVANAFGSWSGARRLRLDLESHGREALFPDVDLSRTVGWFTALYPLCLDLGIQAGPLADLQAVAGQLDAVPRRGIGYGLLRYLHADAEIRERLAAVPPPEVSFNYQGRIDDAILGEDVGLASEPTGPLIDPATPASHRFAVNAMVLDDRLHVDWSAAAAVDVAVVQRLADAFEAALCALVADAEGAAEEQADDPAQALVPLGPAVAVVRRPADARPTPFFCLPGGGGNPRYLEPLAQRLGGARPFVALQARGLDGQQAPHESIAAMAAHVLAAVRSVQPHGPYLIGGHSLGAWAAYHLCWLLQQEGETVTGLVVFDTPAPLAENRRQRADHDQLDDGRWLRGIVKLIERVSGTPFPVSEDVLSTLSIDAFLARFHRHLQALHLLPPDADPAHARGLLEVSKANTRSMLAYERPPAGLEVPVHLLRAQRLHPDDAEVMVAPSDDPTWGWASVTSAPAWHRVVPGDHLDMFSPANVISLAPALAEAFTRFVPVGTTRNSA